MLERLYSKVIAGEDITIGEALDLYEHADLEELCAAANRIRSYNMGNAFDMCTIINAKSGRCGENCRFCAQSCRNHTGVDEYPLLPRDEIIEGARTNAEQGVLRYSIVTSGRKLSSADVDKVCDAVRDIVKNIDIRVCVSFGLLDREAFARLKAAGVSRVHNNLETSRAFFPHICTTHTFDDKIAAIKAAQDVGLEVCSGGIMGLGESYEDRIDMAMTLRELGIKSVPINVLNPIKGTPLEHNVPLTSDEVRRIIAVYRFILPHSVIRLAGGRGPLADKGVSCFLSGANAAISGDMLTTQGITVDTDKKILKELGFEVRIDE